MTLSILNCKLVIGTELPDILLSNTSLNIENNESIASFSNLILMPLNWGNMDDISAITRKFDKITHIIACECLYEEAPFDKLLLTLIEFAKIYKGVSILFVYKKRYVYQEECLKILSEYFDINYIPREEYYFEFRDKEQYQMLTLKYKEKE